MSTQEPEDYIFSLEQQIAEKDEKIANLEQIIILQKELIK